MTESPRSVEAFRDQAERYDRDAELLMGNRAWHRQYLADLLRCFDEAPRSFVDLACGTGFFTEVFFEVFPGIRGLGVDGSEAMLERARSRFDARGVQLELRRGLLQSVDWATIDDGSTPLVFSAFAIHHLSDDEKRVLIGEIFEHLGGGGHFVLFDSFRPDERAADDIVERLTALDIQRRVRDARGTEPQLDRIIARDREVKAAEGDQEAPFEAHLRWLREIGFVAVTPVFLDARMGGIIATKPA
ncbi:MAG: methyltransferase domain-containing protein [Actinomycetota bacterium]